jgi:hypothetical protein
MNDESENVRCETHGTAAAAAYVCSHLAADPVQRWNSDRASPDNPWPDAWCDQCNTRFLREGSWNDKNSDEVELRILCGLCYEDALGKSIGRLHDAELKEWHAFVEDCHAELRVKQERLKHEYALSRHLRWDWDQESAQLIFSNDGVPAVVATIEFVGSISAKSNTWLWSWANPSTLEAVRSRIAAVYDLGEARGFPHLTVPKWPAEPVDGWDMAAIATHVLGAAGVYRTPRDGGFTFLLLMEVRAAQ